MIKQKLTVTITKMISITRITLMQVQVSPCRSRSVSIRTIVRVCAVYDILA